ncbi:hypothetical protein [Sediminibacterium sp.]|uniref:hypothetical protein n=1 Tax=Sediminibacterium sp. TaxID=1917865 RepID=UPI002733A029|nr:hypothetical protein [Sediminibacterium sp.]MDP3393871.1 hypothetical protein [Sediminibacterium sp.]MDP3568799.1 hypothetical protein [Sediminibacterium sp.]
MKQKAVPGHSMILGETLQPYEILVGKFSSWNIFIWAASLNNELYASLDFHSNQLRLLELLFRGYNPEQQKYLNEKLIVLANNGFGADAFHIFHKRYLLPLIVKELRRNEQKSKFQKGNGIEFPVLMAYLTVIDEEHAIDQQFLDKSKNVVDEAEQEYNIIWTNILRQFHFNEPTSPLVELCKLYVLCKYSSENWPEHFAEYLASLGMKTIGHLTKSYVDIINFLQLEALNKSYRKMVDLTPGAETNKQHLDSMCCNSTFGKTDASIADLKKRPLFSFPDGRYRVVDPNFLYKHIYRGTYFNLYHTTGLSKQLTRFNEYSNTISKKVLEELFFKAVMQSLNSDEDILITDRQEDHSPDAYMRMHDTILLIEFKAYVINDKYIDEPDFDSFKKYIQENFIRNASGKGKGAGQIIEQIKLLSKGLLNDDIGVKDLTDKKYHIYPIICHNDFQFGVTALNDYINKQFQQEILNEKLPSSLIIHDLTLICLDWIVDIYLRGGNFQSLTKMVYAYHQILEDRKKLFRPEMDTEVYLNSRSSFDEVYKNLFIHSLPNVSDNLKPFKQFIDRLGFTDEMLSKELN